MSRVLKTLAVIAVFLVCSTLAGAAFVAPLVFQW